MSLDDRTPDAANPEKSTAATSTAAAPTAPPPASVNLVIVLLLVATFVMILNETIMSVAIPVLMVDLEITASTAQWLTTAFMLTMAVVIPTTGFLLQRFSTRAVFIAAMSLFTAGTLLAAVSPGFGILVIGRVIQASGTAVMIPLMITTVLTFIPENRRGTIMGFISIVIAVAPATGPTISGAILDHLDWRWMFYFMLPIAVVALILGIVLVRNITTPRKAPFDIASVLLSVVAFAGLIYGLNSIGEAATGDTAVPPWLPIVVGVVGLALFVWRQISLQATESALLDLRPFKTRTFTVGIIILLVAMAALFGAIMLLPLFMQNVWHASTMQTGLVLLPGGLVMGLIAPFVGALYDKVGPRPLVTPGAILVTIALILLTTLNAEPATSEFWMFTDQEWKVVGIHVLLSLGLGSMMTPLMTSALGSVPPMMYSHASAIQNTLQQLAGAAGTALFITVMTRGMTAEINDGVDPVQAQAHGIHQAFYWGAGFAVLAVVLSLLVRRPPRTDDVEEVVDASAPATMH
ncbi:multidrug efflux MFS transporter [Gordonia sp. HY442]|uniref:MDR family MFS transporter n=1 Tax=Gordonia zhenghanii TaxID=2911516 RepID=UPI001F19D39D|nr:MDR family MFS transporter [Gordonia zhenghanii]MCF8607533.1 multidrug efflux MFS transporter [Gordonia zhenghanii]